MTRGPADAAVIRLKRVGWSVGETVFSGPHRTTWLVSGSNGEDLIHYNSRGIDSHRCQANGPIERRLITLGAGDRALCTAH
jgi:hypothetical protein